MLAFINLIWWCLSKKIRIPNYNWPQTYSCGHRISILISKYSKIEIWTFENIYDKIQRRNYIGVLKNHAQFLIRNCGFWPQRRYIFSQRDAENYSAAFYNFSKINLEWLLISKIWSYLNSNSIHFDSYKNGIWIIRNFILLHGIL